MRAVDPPPTVRDRYGDWSWAAAWSYEGTITTWRLRSPEGEVRYLKVRAVEEEPRLGAEAVRLQWARSRLRVPEVVASGTEEDVDWLITRALPGRDATDPGLRADPHRLVPALAAGLRRLHDTPIDGCPFRLSVADAVSAVRRRVGNGRAGRADLHEEYRHLSLPQALARVEELAPGGEDLVLCHGDYCFPNVLVENWTVTAYLDLGELDVADRWWDVAVASWSVTWNLSPEWEQVFLDAYGIKPDDRRRTFWRLVYDLIS